MAFFHQLKLLLWKNFTLKKRSPFILFIELIVPLILFLILVAIRKHRMPTQSGIETWQPNALPSAGIIPLLQSFCKDGSVLGSNGYKTYPNASINQLLIDLADVADTAVFSAIFDLKEFKENFESFQKDSLIFTNSDRMIRDFKFASLLNDKQGFVTFLSKNLSMSDDDITSLMETAFNGTKLTTLLLENNEQFFDAFIDNAKNFKLNELQKSIVLQALFDPSSLTQGPTWMQVLSAFSQVSGITSQQTDWEKLQDFLKSQYLSDKHLKPMLCNGDLEKMFNTETLQTTTEFFCSLNKTSIGQLSLELQNQLNWTSLAKQLHVNGPKMADFVQRADHIRKDLLKMSSLEDAVRKLQRLSKSMQINLTRFASQDNTSHPYQLIKNINNLWNRLSPIICGNPNGPPKSPGDDDDDDDEADQISSFLLDSRSEPTTALKFMLYLMTNNPMILYAPNNTDADKIIEKSSWLLSNMKMANTIANKWLAMSASFLEMVASKRTQEVLKKMLMSIDRFPFVYEPHFKIDYTYFNTTPGEIRRYLMSNKTIARYLNFTKMHLKQVIVAMMTNETRTSALFEEIKMVDTMARGWLALTKPMKLNIFYGFSNESALSDFIQNATSDHRQKKQILSAVVFDNINTDGSLPKHLIYRLRMDGRLLPSTQKVRSPYWVPNARGGNSDYFYRGSAWVQDQIERAIIEVMTGKNITAPGLYVQEMPYPCYTEDNFMFVLQYIMPLCIVISFIYTVSILVQSIVYEKEHRLKEVMKMMGLSNAVHWTAWFITSFAIMMAIVVLLTMVLKLGDILKYSNSTIVFLFLMLAAMATTNFCFLISIFFSKAKIAAACGGIIYFVTYMPYIFITVQEGGANPKKISTEYKSLASLFSTTAFGFGARYFALFEQNGVGIQWDNIGTSPLEHDSFNMMQVIFMLVLDIFLYGVLVWYIETVFPGMYGIPRPYYFPLQVSYWLGPNATIDTLCCKMRSTRQREESSPNQKVLLATEEEPTHLKLGVAVNNLVKIYGKGCTPAVDNLSFNLYEGQITSFLGHNGAGKTTTMSLLTGLFPPTSGTASIYGHDIHRDMDKIRRSLGMCPQHNVLYGKMTVEEHLWFYARLKGMSQAQVKNETDRILEDIDLPEKRNSQVDTLSGGMKRKLSVAMAFVGGSRTVILDEPTAGVDPYARRAIWELLAKYKDGRTILLSTHFMDEADILGDRIAIISHGKLRCFGSSLFLKNQFGDGYHLTLVKDQQQTADTTSLSTKEITAFIQGYVPTAQLICETLYEISYILPDKGKEKKGMLKELFENLEVSKEKLGCSCFGLQDTTLEEVFLKVTEATMTVEDDNGLLEDELTTAVDVPLVNINTTNNKETGQCKPKEKTHRRSVSTSLAGMSSLDAVECQRTCAHRRTASGGFSGHRRALSSDLKFVTATKNKSVASQHSRFLSGLGKVNPILNESWKNHVSGSRVLSKSLHHWQQFYALLLKRVHHTRRNLQGLLTHILLPGLFVSLAMAVALAQPKIESYKPLVLSPTMFHPAPYYIPFSNSKQGSLAQAFKMEDTLKLPSGIGADCVINNDKQFATNQYSKEYLERNAKKFFDGFCSKQLSGQPYTTIKQSYEHQKDPQPTCKCVHPRWLFECDKGVERKPEMFTTVTQDTLINVTDQDFQTYLLNTNYNFKRRRYGALTFGDIHHLVPDSVVHSPFISIQKLFSKQSARVWFSNKGFHAMPTFINAMSNTILRASVTPEMGNPAAYGITAISHPLNFVRKSLDLDSIKQGTHTVIAIFVIIAMSFVPASFVVFLVTERTSNAKHIQFVSGLNPVLYWLSNYMWDLLNFLIPIFSCMVIFYIFNVPAYASKSNFPAVCALFICYGWSITPMMYPASFIFKEASTAYVVLIILNLFLGITCTVTTSILQLFPNDSQLQLVSKVLKLVFLMFPNYCLGKGLMDMAYNELANTFYEQLGQSEKIRSPFDWDIVTCSLVCMLTEGVIFFVLTLFIEYKSTISRSSKTSVGLTMDSDDQDVAVERHRVLSGGADHDLLRVENITKVYHSKQGKQLAVNRLCVGVRKGECFGLLGVNGAGKTTTFKMLSGDASITSGDAFIENKSVVHDLAAVHKRIGYCPQFDALFDDLTAEEHLYFYARLKGIPETEIKNICSWMIKKMALSRYADKRSRTYSGGNKRKLSAAIALIGNPSLVFMDEPTTGMDPGARRFLWNIILSIVREKSKSVVLTSHSMEECEALCTRLAIMVNGQFKCLGSTQHIKNRFGDGYIVMIRVKGSLPSMAPVKNFMQEHFQDSVMKECHHNMIQYQIPSANGVSLSYIFTQMESVCQELSIDDYSVSQTSLDNVFVNFAKYQRDYQGCGASHSRARLAFSALKGKWREMKTRVRSRKCRFSELVQLPMDENVGVIGEGEDEITFEGIGPMEFTPDTARLTFDMA